MSATRQHETDLKPVEPLCSGAEKHRSPREPEERWQELTRAGLRFSSLREVPNFEPQHERHHLTPSHDGCRVGQDETPCDVDGAALGSEIL